MNKVPAVVTPLDDHMGLDIARSLAHHDIPVYGIDSDPTVPGKYSNSCRFALCPNPEGEGEAAYIQYLVDFSQKLGCKPVLFPLSDMHVLLCSRHRDVLQEHYEFVMPEQETIERLTSKDGLGCIAEEYGIPAPQTVFMTNTEPITAVAKRVKYPAVLKPTESTYWHTPEITHALRKGLLSAQAKVIYCRDAAELIDAYQRIAAIDNRLVIQEVIPGEDSRLVYISFYLDRQSRPLGIFAGRKHRVIPIGFGSASYVRSFYDPELVEIASRLLSSTHYRGLGGIEFKRDARDNQYKLIEFNTRFGMWDGLSVRCGVDLPYIAYCDTLGLPVDAQFRYRCDVIWVDWQRDVRAAIDYWRKGQLSLGEWRKSLAGEKMWAIYSAKDWRPGAAFTFRLAQKMIQRIAKV